ncbi:Uncharacterized protein dnm_078220 [Desulfonema magnum]|uniref:Uncharacterized protein n=1 Tax=Desulfonema magnum TaxID=45655 RepID=A0A975BU97_9BACT|nr:Uncharacterized protein dnm_078220 [Desulfonema magnum]
MLIEMDLEKVAESEAIQDISPEVNIHLHSMPGFTFRSGSVQRLSLRLRSQASPKSVIIRKNLAAKPVKNLEGLMSIYYCNH